MTLQAGPPIELVDWLRAFGIIVPCFAGAILLLTLVSRK